MEMLESGFTSCEEELLENVTLSLVSSAYTDDGGTWKSSSGSTVESLTKCEDLEMEEESKESSPRLGHKPPRWTNATSPPRGPESLSSREPLSPRTQDRPFRRSAIPVIHHHTPPSAQAKLLTKCQSLQDLSKCLALLHTDRLNNTYNSTDTINSQSLSSTKDSGFQRSYSSNSICSVRRRNKYDHVESKVRQYIQDIKDSERKRKALKRSSLHAEAQDEPASPSRRSSLQDTELLGECTSGGSKSCCNTRRSSYQDELRVLFNIDDESNRALTTLIKKLEVEKFERDLLIENLQVKYHELNNKLTSANETISDLKQQVTLSPLATSLKCVAEPSSCSTSVCKTRSAHHHRRYADRSHHHPHSARRCLSPVQSLSSQASRTKPPDTKAPGPASSRSSHTSSRAHRQVAQAPQPACRKKLNLPREDPILKVQRWQDSLTGVESSDSATGGFSYPVALTSSPLQKSTTLAYLPPATAPSHLANSPESTRTCFKAFDSSFHLGRSKTSPNIQRSTVYINIGDHSGETRLDENSNLCPLDKEPSRPEKQITLLNIYEAEDGTKMVQDVSKRSASTNRESPGTTKVVVNASPDHPTGILHSSRHLARDSPHQVIQTSPTQRPLNYGLSQSKTTPNMKRVSINLSTEIKSSTDSSDSLNTTTEDDDKTVRRPPSVPPNTRLFKELSSLSSCLNEVDEQIHVLKNGIDNLIKSSSQKSVHSFLQQP